MSGLFWAFALYGALTLISMATMSIGAGILILTLLICAGGPVELFRDLGDELSRPRSRLYFRLSLGLFGACVLSLLVAHFFPVSYGGRVSTVHFWADVSKAWYLFWPLLLVVGLRRFSVPYQNQVLRVWISVFVVVSAIGVVQYFTGWPRPQPIPGTLGRFHATLFLGHHLSVASILIFPFFAALDFLARESEPGKRILSPFLVASAAILGLIALFDTYSRTLWIALPCGLLLWAAWNFRRFFPKGGARGKRLSLILAALGALVLTVALASQSRTISQRMILSFGLHEREDLWRANWEFFKARPLTGVGWRHNLETSGFYLMAQHPGESVFSGHAHNNLLEMLGGTGLIGTVAWLLWTLGVLSLLWRERNSADPTRFARGLLCAWLVFEINGLTQMNFWDAKVLHQLSWVIAWSLLWGPRA